MSQQVTITDVQEVALMETDDIRKWISLHRKSLKDESMVDYHDAIKADQDILIEEYKLRNPMVVAVKELTKAVNELKETIKEKKNGTTKT